MRSSDGSSEVEISYGSYNEPRFVPEVYSPNTAYPETQYASAFDEDAEWNEEHQGF
jgi:hypothetical protein